MDLLRFLGISSIFVAAVVGATTLLRVTDHKSTYRMPPNSTLDATEECVIARWVANGARR